MIIHICLGILIVVMFGSTNIKKKIILKRKLNIKQKYFNNDKV